MATRSDFGQKLLTDLRMRKERMDVPASHSTRNSKGMPRDSYGNSSHNFKGSRQTKSLEPVSTRTTNPHRKSNNGNRLLTIEESSKQLVPYEGGRNTEQISDLSRALALAFRNTKNNRKLYSSSNNPVLNFLHRIGKRALDIGKIERKNIASFNKPSSQIINVSNLHINEISKGVKKLNQILRACSNDNNFDGYSVEIGKDLLKEALDLEESLKMIGNFQEDSEKLINIQRKSRIRLLDENGEEEQEEESEFSSSVPQKKIFERPRFSFDKPLGNSQNTKKAVKVDPKQSLMALTYTTEATDLFKKQLSSTSDVASHKRTASCGSDFRPEKGKLPNIIAKLMGLEEVTQIEKSSSNVKEDIVLKTDENKNSTKIIKKMIESGEYMAPTASGKKMKRNSDDFKFQNEKKRFTQDFLRLNKNPKDLHVKMRRKEHKNHEEYIGVERGQAKEVVVHNNKFTETKRIIKGTSEGKEIRLEGEKRKTNIAEKPKIEQKYVEKNQVVHRKIISKDLHDEKPNKFSTNSKNETGILRKGKSINSTADTRNLMFLNEIVSKPKNSKEEKPINTISIERVRDHIEVRERENSRKKDSVVTKKKGTQETISVTFKNQISFLQKKQEHKPTRSIQGAAENLSNSIFKEAEMHIISPNKSEVSAKMLIEVLPSKKEANELQLPFIVSNLHESTQDMATKIISIDPIDNEDQLPHLNEDKYPKSQKFEMYSGDGCNEASLDNSEVPIVSLNKSDAGAKMLIEDLPSDKKNNELKRQFIVHDRPTLNESSQDTVTKIFTNPVDGEDQIPNFNEDTRLEPQNFEVHSENGYNESSLDNSNPQELEEKENPIPKNEELFIVTEIHLKQILLKSQLFINTAVALFNISIPFDFHDATDNININNYSKVMLDCAYEVTRKKGKLQELSFYPSINISTAFVKVNSFNDLVTELYTDFETLKYIYEDTSEEHDAAEYIQEMLEKDIVNRDPEINAMWDLGWKEVDFAMIEREELIKEMESFLIDGVIENIANELLHMSA